VVACLVPQLKLTQTMSPSPRLYLQLHVGRLSVGSSPGYRGNRMPRSQSGLLQAIQVGSSSTFDVRPAVNVLILTSWQLRGRLLCAHVPRGRPVGQRARERGKGGRSGVDGMSAHRDGGVGRAQSGEICAEPPSRNALRASLLPTLPQTAPTGPCPPEVSYKTSPRSLSSPQTSSPPPVFQSQYSKCPTPPPPPPST
jgi:hypothetical protein